METLENKFDILIGTVLEFTSYIKLVTFSKYRNSIGRSFPFKKKGIACSLA